MQLFSKLPRWWRDDGWLYVSTICSVSLIHGPKHHLKAYILTGVQRNWGGKVCLPKLDSQSVRVMETGCCFYTQSRMTKIKPCVHVYGFAGISAATIFAKLNLPFEADFIQYNSYFPLCRTHKQTKLNGNRFACIYFSMEMVVMEISHSRI